MPWWHGSRAVASIKRDERGSAERPGPGFVTGEIDVR